MLDSPAGMKIDLQIFIEDFQEMKLTEPLQLLHSLRFIIFI